MKKKDEQTDLYLRAFELSDYVTTSKWRNDPEVIELLAGNFFYSSPDREKKWLEEVIMNDRVHTRLAIVLKENDKLIGMVNLTNMNLINRNAEFSILIGEKEEWGKGYAKQATRQMLDFGFNQRNLERIYLVVDVNQHRTISFCETVGFKKEGLLRKNHFRNGEYKDVFMYSLLREEFKQEES